MKASLLFPLLAAAYVSAHGFVATITIDGTAYQGNPPRFGSPPSDNPSIVRQIATNGPINGASDPSMSCGIESLLASRVADANPGSQVIFDWKAGGGQNWPHDTGPMLTYMASCGDTTCDQFNSANARWFKIQQVARRADGKWEQATLFAGGVATVNLPATLAPGNYLIRHEIIALHLAEQFQGAEFYPSCSQLRVGGNQSGGPSQNELVSFPGAYSDNDPGIFSKTFFDPSAQYVYPGPPIAKFVTGAASDTGNTGSTGSAPVAVPSGTTAVPSGTTATTSPKSTSSQVPAPASNNGSSSSTCKLKKKSPAVQARAAVHRPRHYSRVMRALVFGKSH